MTQANRAPAFGSATYSFSIAEDASTGAAVGSVSATDADSDGITYSIEAGNGDGKFAIDGSTGAITTAGALDHGTTPSYTLTVQADDGEGGTDTATVNVSVTEVDESTAGPLTGFTLVDASDQSVLATLTAGTSVALADPNGGSYAIRADVDSTASIGSVRLVLSGAKSVTRTESYAPYSLYGDSYEGAASDLHGQALPSGGYTLRATAYSERGRRRRRAWDPGGVVHDYSGQLGAGGSPSYPQSAGQRQDYEIEDPWQASKDFRPLQVGGGAPAAGRPGGGGRHLHFRRHRHRPRLHSWLAHHGPRIRPAQR